MPSKYFKWQLAFDTGWTMEQIEQLPYSLFREYLQIKDAEGKARSS